MLVNNKILCLTTILADQCKDDMTARRTLEKICKVIILLKSISILSNLAPNFTCDTAIDGKYIICTLNNENEICWTFFDKIRCKR